MDIESIDISRYHFARFDRPLDSDSIQKQNLPFLSVVQADRGVYGLTLDTEGELKIPEGRFYVAPSFTPQSLKHYRSEGRFAARYLFIDVILLFISSSKASCIFQIILLGVYIYMAKSLQKIW